MAYFSNIDEINTRRFRLVDDSDQSIFAVYDQCRAYTLYAKIGCDEKGKICFVSEPVAYWDDEIEEIR